MCCWLPLLHLMEARLEFVSPAAGCIIALALKDSEASLGPACLTRWAKKLFAFHLTSPWAKSLEIERHISRRP
jgi:hypothetical protein